MAQGRRIAAVTLIAVAVTVVAAASAPALSVPTTTTPTVTTPTVTVPAVKTPVVTTPTVTTPKASTPVVTTPPVKPPPAPVKPPSKQSVQVKPAPVVKTITQKAPARVMPGGGGGASGTGGGGAAGGVVNGVSKTVSGVSGGGGTAGTAGGATGGGGSVPGSTSGGLAPLPGGGPGGPGTPGGTYGGPGAPSGAGFGPGPGVPGSLAFSMPGARVGRTSGGVSAFAAAVASLAGCFYALTPLEQQVLTVRTGLDGRQPLSRGEAARLLGTSPNAVARTERGALGTLRSASVTDGCMPVGAITAANAVTAFIGGPFGPIGFVTPSAAPESRSEPGVPPQQTFASTSLADRLAGLEDGPATGGPLSLLVVIALMLCASFAALVLEARRQVH